MNKKQYSLKARLLKLILTSYILISLISLVAIYLDAQHEVEELFDASLAQSSRVLLGLLHPETIKQNHQNLTESLDLHSINFDIFDSEATPYGHKYEKKLAFQVWDNNKSLLLKSSSIGSKAMAKLIPGFSYQQIGNHHWRTFCLYSEHSEIWLIMGERDDIRNELTHNIAFNHILPLVIILPALAGLIWLTINQAIRPLQSLVKQVDKQQYDKLESINKDNLPSEISILSKAINHLFHRLNKNYQREKGFIADVAHELRNPLAALSVHNDNAIAESKDSEIKGTLINMRKGVGRLSRLVAQLLALSRADIETDNNQFIELDLITLCHKLEHQFKFMAERKEQQLIFNLHPSELVVNGVEILLTSMLSNLIDNALRYSPEKAIIEVFCGYEDNQIVVTIEDSGKGIPDEFKEQVQERFYRLPGSQQVGSGLGLSIVQQIAEIHNIELLLQNSSRGGLKVCLSF